MLNRIKQYFQPENRHRGDDPEGYAKLLDEINGTGDKIVVDTSAALTFAPFKAAVEMIANDVSACPLQLHKRTVEPGEDSVMRKHSTHFVVERRFNRYTPAYQGWRTAIAQMETCGSGYLWIVRDSATGLLKELWNIDPHCVQHEIDAKSRHQQYRVTIDGNAATFAADEILHLRGLTIRNGKPLNPVELLKHDLRLALGIRRFENKQAKRGFKRPAVLSVPVGTPVAARERVEQQIKKSVENPDHWMSTLVLRDGAALHELGQSNDAAKLIALQEQQTRMVAMHYRIPIERFGLTSSVSYNSATAATANYIQSTLLSRFKSITSECNLKLLPRRDQRSGEFFFRHDTDVLLESDSMALTDMVVKQRNAGLITGNEGRGKLGYPASTDELADKLLNPQTTDMASETEKGGDA